MSPWLRVLGLFGAVVLAALLLRVLPPLLVLALLIGGIVYANHVLVTKPKRQRSRLVTEALGLRSVPEGEAVLLGLPFALLGRPGAVASEVAAGTWRGAEVRVFDLEIARTAELGGPTRFTCALVPLPFSAPHLVVEPTAFLTPPQERSSLPACRPASERVAAAFDVRCEDPAFARSFLGDRVSAWLLGEEERVGFELRGSAALLYRPWVPAEDRDLVLDPVAAFLAAVPLGRPGEAR